MRALRPGLGATVIALLIGGGGAFWALRRTWARATVDGGGLPDSKVSVTGAAAHGGATGLALVAGVCALGVLAASPRIRRWIGVLAALCAVGAIGLVVTGGASMSAARDEAAGKLTGTVHVWHPTTAEPLTLAALVVALAAAVRVVVAGPSWPAMGRKYEAPSTARDATDDDMWKTLDRGEDPTG